MREKGNIIRWCSAVAAAAAIVAAVTVFEAGLYGADTVSLMHILSDGFYLAAIIYIGFGLLTWIAEAGNFYGLQYLGYSILRIFSVRKERFEERKNYYEYCLEKKAKQKENGKSPMRKILLIIGVLFLLMSLIFTGLFYRLQ